MGLGSVLCVLEAERGIWTMFVFICLCVHVAGNLRGDGGTAETNAEDYLAAGGRGAFTRQNHSRVFSVIAFFFNSYSLFTVYTFIHIYIHFCYAAGAE